MTYQNYKFHRGLYRCMAILFFPLSFSVHAGVVVNGTRFIYGENQDSGILLTVSNSDSTDYLVQSKIVNDDGSDMNGGEVASDLTNLPFIITPPLINLAAKKENSLRIIYVGKSLPSDRESIFRISIAAIPAGKPEKNSLQVAIRSKFKLLYRPSNLKGNPSQAYQELTWLKNDGNVSVTNPSPFFVTLFQLSINGKIKNDAGMIPPYSTITQRWCPKTGECQLQWKALNDYGGVMPAWRIFPSQQASLGTPVNK